MRDKYGSLVSDRGKPLLHQTVEDYPVITLENYCKWYNIFVIQPSGVVEKVDPSLILELGSDGKWVDHIYHPTLLLRIAKHYGGEVPDTTLEVAAGRWVLEKDLCKGITYGLDDDE